MTILHTSDNDRGRRLDRILRKALPGLPLSRIHRLLREGRVLVDGKAQAGDFRLEAGQSISAPVESPVELPQDAPRPSVGVLNIIYESADLLALNKAAGQEVHGADSLDTLVQGYLAPKLGPSLSFKPGPLHRLDKPTSGIVVFSVSLEGARRFSKLMREGGVHKQYLAVVEGRIQGPGLWEDSLLRDRDARKSRVAENGQEARTRYTPLAWEGPSTLLMLEPETGRTHQIRVQATAHGHPLAGDVKYLPRSTGRDGNQGFLLHAWKLGTNDPALLPPSLEAPLPDYFASRIKEIFGEGVIRTLTEKTERPT
ncbi:MAG: RluA family pseudouridine synthase [Treponema sp.]|jgi:23S rRNA pseudouridine955/2504/2580 synthase|nr:RluA family pseudouridine synthase [Treponema sp.]